MKFKIGDKVEFPKDKAHLQYTYKGIKKDYPWEGSLILERPSELGGLFYAPPECKLVKIKEKKLKKQVKNIDRTPCRFPNVY